MSEVAKHFPDVTTFAANIVVFFAAIAATVAGSLAMVKKIKSGWEETFPAKTPAVSSATGDVVTRERNLMGALLMETTTAAMLTEAQRTLAEKVDENTDETRELRFAMTRVADALNDLRHEMQRRPHG